MRPFRDIPIQRKLRVVILAVCSVALVVACGVLFAVQYVIFRRDFEQDLGGVAAIIASNSVRALTDHDGTAARQILSSLKAKPHIMGASIMLANGEPLAQIGTPLLPRDDGSPVALQIAGLQSLGEERIYFQPIVRNGARLGTLILHPDYRGKQNELFRLYASLLATVLLTSFLIAALISWRLERLILEPIRYLAQISREIAGRHDFSLRAQKMADDEIGSFTESFNHMLHQVEQRDRDLRHEITERKRAEEELEHLHHQLLENSRHAGMAEVATGVLHNVGNVLNSVNVSASLLAEKLNRSRIEKLHQATELLRSQNGNLSSFLHEDERGRLLPGYLGELSAQLSAERREALTEIEGLIRNIEHIKEIVAMQQGYARVGGLVEPLSLATLLDDALRMNATSFQRHGLSVIRQYARVPDAAVDKHKVLQILLNILRNAKFAMEDVPPQRRKLTIALRRKADGMAEVRIADGGIGIAPESLTKIFSHGFTTRKDGHGFGLHSAALAAQQMGGRISAESPGLGLGATFILELPLAQPAPLPVPLS